MASHSWPVPPPTSYSSIRAPTGWSTRHSPRAAAATRRTPGASCPPGSSRPSCADAPPCSTGNPHDPPDPDFARGTAHRTGQPGGNEARFVRFPEQSGGGAAVSEAILVLEDGRTFRGEAYGATGETFGEAGFNTGMTGYQETLTDPSYHRQVVVQTAPHTGNTGVNDEDAESRRIWVSGYVVRDPARRPSSWRSRRSLDAELCAQGVVGIS